MADGRSTQGAQGFAALLGRCDAGEEQPVPSQVPGTGRIRLKAAGEHAPAADLHPSNAGDDATDPVAGGGPVPPFAGLPVDLLLSLPQASAAPPSALAGDAGASAPERPANAGKSGVLPGAPAWALPGQATIPVTDAPEGDPFVEPPAPDFAPDLDDPGDERELRNRLEPLRQEAERSESGSSERPPTSLADAGRHASSAAHEAARRHLASVLQAAGIAGRTIEGGGEVKGSSAATPPSIASAVATGEGGEGANAGGEPVHPTVRAVAAPRPDPPARGVSPALFGGFTDQQSGGENSEGQAAGMPARRCAVVSEPPADSKPALPKLPAAPATQAAAAVAVSSAAAAVDVPAVRPAAVAAAPAVPDVEVARQVVRAVSLAWHDQVGEAKMRLTPEHLGEVTVSLRVERGVVSAILQADSPTARQWIREHEGDLRQALESQGLRLDSLLVTEEGERRGQQQEQQPRPRVPRRNAPDQEFVL